MKVGWKIVPLGELLTVQNGFAFSSKNFNFTSGTPLIRIRDLKSGTETEVNFDSEFDPAYLVERGDLLIGMDGEFRCYEWRGESALLNQRVCRLLDFSSALLPRFLFYGINKYLKDIEDVTSFTTVKHLSSKAIKDIALPVPPLEEQQRIVAIMDEAFEGLARARTNAEANLKSAQELFERYLSDQFLHGGLGNKTCTVGDLITLQRGFDITKKDQRDGPFPVVSSGGAKSHHDTAMSKGPGVVIGRKGSIGSVYFVDEDFWPHDTTLWVKDFKGNDPRLVYYLMRGLNLVELDTGAANPSLNRNLVHPLFVNWPGEGDQTTISRQLNEVEEQTVELEKQYSHNLRELDDLRQAILQKAFAGELT